MMLYGADALEVLARRDAFWRVADNAQGDAIALGVLAAAFLSVLATIVCALRVCALVCGTAPTRRRRPPARPSLPIQPSLVVSPPSSPRQQQQPSCLPLRLHTETVPSPLELGQYQQQQRHCHLQRPAVSWATKWAPAVANERAVAAARIEARRAARREPAAPREKPLPRSVLVALDRVSARVAALPDPH
ncbi:hypothetical protein pqer_cds_51 [Pandoravirus quercus]|uniref:Uncharacterized protein n=2 Tax=Pandoravirus TaxID=2060084 RepID=A0A2U7U7S4_9VIRU|nr:hypothetical protein pqer_cds_51 [Pandoravirus quercus]AVK74473.1 hypothetical protein pqer_cds_51 [Pandoravirus quercus]QBZ80645.1 hypothetical protein pclt_cds_47 [Pandoravirus celtis]